MDKDLNTAIQTSPEPKIIIRTMESDIKAIEQSGGDITNSRIDNFEKQKTENNFTNQENTIFAPDATVTQTKQTKWKITAIIINVLLIIIVFWLIGYFIISPWFFPKEMPIVQ